MADGLGRCRLPEKPQGAEHGDVHVEEPRDRGGRDHSAAASDRQHGADRRDDAEEHGEGQERSELEGISGRFRTVSVHPSPRQKEGAGCPEADNRGKHRGAGNAEQRWRDDGHDPRHAQHGNARGERSRSGERPGTSSRCRRSRQRDGDGGRGDDRACQAAYQDAASGTEGPDGDIAEIGNRGRQHREQPHLPGVEASPWIDRTRRQEGQDDRGHHGEHECRAQFDPGNPPEQPVQEIATGKNGRERGSARRRA